MVIRCAGGTRCDYAFGASAGTRGVPVLAVSFEHPGKGKGPRGGGFQAFIRAPVTPGDLECFVDECLERIRTGAWAGWIAEGW